MAAKPRSTGDKPKKKSAGRVAFRAAGFTVDAASSVVSSIFKIFGSVLLIQPSVFRNFSFACVILFLVGVAASLGEYWLKHHPKNVSGGDSGVVSQNTPDGL